MAGRDLIEFSIAIEPGRASGSYRSVVEFGRVAERASFELPFEAAHAERYLTELLEAPRPRRLQSRSEQAVQAFGEVLFRAVLSGSCESLYRRALLEARRRGSGLRVNLELRSPELDSIPWEYLFDAVENKYLSLARELTFVRRTPAERPVGLWREVRPFRILVVGASPRDLPPLDVDREVAALRHAIGSQPVSAEVTIEVPRPATLQRVQQALDLETYDVVYFIGHGDFDPGHDDGYLVFETESDVSHRVLGRDFGRIIEARNIRLVVLNACDGARRSRVDRFRGIASSLLAMGVPATVSMQYEVADSMACLFGPALLSALLADGRLDAAVTKARFAVFAEPGSSIEWGTPVFHSAIHVDEVFPGLVHRPTTSLVARASAGEDATNRTVSQRVAALALAILCGIGGVAVLASVRAGDTSAAPTTEPTRPGPSIDVDQFSGEASPWPVQADDWDGPILALADCCGTPRPTWLRCSMGWCIGAIDTDSAIGLWSIGRGGVEYRGPLDKNGDPYVVLREAGVDEPAVVELLARTGS